MKSTLQRLSEWYSAQCDGDWEHGSGFKITTIDNPGVAVDIHLADTSLATEPFEEKRDQYDSKMNWMVCKRTADHFVGRGAPSRLEDILLAFLEWADQYERGSS